MFSSRVFRSIYALGLAFAAAGLLTGCPTVAVKDRPKQDVVLSEKLKGSEYACIRWQQAEDEAVKTGNPDAQRFHEVRLRACQQYEQDKQALTEYQSQHPSPSGARSQP